MFVAGAEIILDNLHCGYNTDVSQCFSVIACVNLNSFI